MESRRDRVRGASRVRPAQPPILGRHGRGVGGARPAELGGGRAELGHAGTSRRASCGCCPTTWPGWTPSSSAAAPATSRPGWPGAGPDRSASTTRPSSWPPPGRSSRSSASQFPLVHGNAERVPYPDASFDLAISEYGAAIWCDPYAWIPEAARLLRPGGRLVFLGNHTLLQLCALDTSGGAAGGGPAASATTSGCTGWSGPPTSASSSPCRTASGSGCCGIRLRGRGPARAAGAARRDPRLQLRHRGLGEALAVRACLQGREAALTQAYPLR